MELDNLLEIFAKRGEIKTFIKILKNIFDMKLEKDEMIDMPKIINRVFDKCLENNDIESLLKLDEFTIKIVNYNIENKTTLSNEIKWLSDWSGDYNINIINIVEGKLYLEKSEEMISSKTNMETDFFEEIWKYNSIFNGKIIQKLPFDCDRDLELPSRLFTSTQWKNFILDNDDIIMDRSMVCCLPFHDGQRRKDKHSYIKYKNTIYFPILEISKRNIYLDVIDNDIREIYKKQAENMYGIIYLKDK